MANNEFHQGRFGMNGMNGWRGPMALLIVIASGCSEDVQSLFEVGPGTTGAEVDDAHGSDEAALETGADATSSTSESGSSGAASSSSEGEDDSPGGALCGDGVISGNEDCDCGGSACTLAGLGDRGCVDVEDPSVPGILTGGDLGCNPASCRYDTTACVHCGDGTINGNEDCEPELPITDTCASEGLGTAGDFTCNASCTYDATACTDCGYRFTFDDCSPEWTTGKLVGAAENSTWACGDPSGATGPEATGVWATNLAGNYAARESSFLQSPALDLAACEGESVTLRMRHWHDFEGGVSNGDGGFVQVSADGQTWTTIDPIEGALYGTNAIDAEHPPVSGAVGFDGQNDEREWVESVFDVTAYTSAPFYVRLVFGSDAGGQRSGWYIDTLEFIGSGDGR